MSYECPIEYIKSPWSNTNWWGGDFSLETIFEKLKNEIPWEQRDAPRKECFFSLYKDTYTYGKGAGIRTYYPNEFTKSVNKIRELLEHYDCGELDLCFVNYYDGPRDHLGWHADDSPTINHEYPIAVVSFGAEREIWFRENGSSDVKKLLLNNGSLLLMKAGMQMTHQHRIPKHSALCGPRISLTFRKML